jgi:transcriptional regulator with XRE-family HTH domain
MFAGVSDLKKLKTLSKSKAYRDSYLSTHVRAGIAYQIRALRDSLGLSQQEFAKRLGTTQSIVSRLENPEHGKLTINTLIEVATALDIALLIRFCSYPDFLTAVANVSPQALAVEAINISIKRHTQETRPASTGAQIILIDAFIRNQTRSDAISSAAHITNSVTTMAM